MKNLHQKMKIPHQKMKILQQKMKIFLFKNQDLSIQKWILRTQQSIAMFNSKTII